MTPSRLVRFALTAAAAVALTAPREALAQRHGARPLRLRPGFRPSPLTLAGEAGGASDPAGLGATSLCVGHVRAAPSHVVVVQRPIDALRLRVQAPSDTTLAVRGPDGQWRCNDDFDGLNPALGGTFPPGRYEVWVGAYRPNETVRYTLEISEGPLERPAVSGALGGGGLNAPPPVALTPLGGGTAPSMVEAPPSTGLFSGMTPALRDSISLAWSDLRPGARTLLWNSDDGRRARVVWRVGQSLLNFWVGPASAEAPGAVTVLSDSTGQPAEVVQFSFDPDGGGAVDVFLRSDDRVLLRTYRFPTAQTAGRMGLFLLRADRPQRRVSIVERWEGDWSALGEAPAWARVR